MKVENLKKPFIYFGYVLERVVEIFYPFLKSVYVVGAMFFTKKILYMCQNHICSYKKNLKIQI
jgi:hypothetical protein